MSENTFCGGVLSRGKNRSCMASRWRGKRDDGAVYFAVYCQLLKMDVALLEAIIIPGDSCLYEGDATDEGRLDIYKILTFIY